MTKDSNKLKALQALNAAIAKLGEHDVKAVIEASKAYYQSGYRDGYQDAAQELAAALRDTGVTGTVSDEPELTTVVLRWLHDNGEDI